VEKELAKISKQDNFTINTNHAGSQLIPQVTGGIVYALLLLIVIGIATVISYRFNVNITPGSINLKQILIPASAYVLMGGIFTALLSSKLLSVNSDNHNKGMLFAFLVFVGVLVASFITGHIKGSGSILASVFYSCLFFLPFVIYQTWHFFKQLSFTGYNKIWYLPERNSKIKPNATVFLNTIHIKIKMAPTYGASEQIYEVTVPSRLSVGGVFETFINNEISNQEKSRFDDLDNQLFGWQFLAPSPLGLGTRLVDPNASLDQNNITNNDLLIARRVPNQPAIEQNNN
jgi:hypothetical protein